MDSRQRERIWAIKCVSGDGRCEGCFPRGWIPIVLLLYCVAFSVFQRRGERLERASDGEKWTKKMMCLKRNARKNRQVPLYAPEEENAR